jgi:phage terminase large subunit
VKGSRASKKTVTIARNFIYNMMKYDGANLLVVRKVGATNKDSTYAELRKAIIDLGVEKEWKNTVNPLELTYLPTGQKIVLRGLDDPQKISGVTVPFGHLCWVWIND